MSCLLLVEDDDDLRENLEYLLRRRGHEVVAAKNGREALDAIDPNDPPCLIVLDLMMPVMDGWEMRETLKADPKLAGVPIVLCSGVADIAEKARNLDALEHLTKPIDLTRLYELVDTYC